MYRFFYYYQPQEAGRRAESSAASGDSLLIKGVQSSRLFAVDPDRMKVLWERPIAKAVAPARRRRSQCRVSWAVPS